MDKRAKHPRVIVTPEDEKSFASGFRPLHEAVDGKLPTKKRPTLPRTPSTGVRG